MPTSINEPLTPAFEPVSGAVQPTITALEPDTCAIGDPDFTLYVTGTGFADHSIIYFAGHDEPTTLNEDGTVSTGVNMAMWHGPDTVNVYVRNGTLHSNALEFTFTDAATREGDELPSDAELAQMTRSELDEIADEHGVDITDASNKHDVIALLRKAEKKSKRKHR